MNCLWLTKPSPISIKKNKLSGNKREVYFNPKENQWNKISQ